MFCPLPLFGVAVFFPIFWVGLLRCYLLVAPSGWCCSLSLFERQLNGANEWNQVAVKQSEAYESEVVHCWGGGVFLPSTFGVAVFSPVFTSGVEVFSLLIRLGGKVFAPLPCWEMVFSRLLCLGVRCFPSSVASNLCLLI